MSPLDYIPYMTARRVEGPVDTPTSSGFAEPTSAEGERNGQSTEPSTVLVLGNPGVGKSTILNLLVGSTYFTSGVSLTGAGLTTSLTSTERNGVTYYDVPGLSDAKHRRAAAMHVTQALRQAGPNCSIIFMVDASSGRVRPDDVTTIRAILGASSDIRQYGVLINKVPERSFEDQIVRRDLVSTVMEIIDVERRTDQFHFVRWTQRLHDEESNALNAAASGVDVVSLRRFALDIVGRCNINPEAVKEVDPRTFDDLQARYAELLADVARFEAQAKEIQRLQELLRTAEIRAAQMEERATQEKARREDAVRQRDAARLAKSQEEAAKVRALEEKAREEAAKVAAQEVAAKTEADVTTAFTTGGVLGTVAGILCLILAPVTGGASLCLGLVTGLVSGSTLGAGTLFARFFCRKQR